MKRLIKHRKREVVDKMCTRAEDLFLVHRNQCRSISQIISKYIDWDDEISVEYQLSDGLIICDSKSNNVPVKDFLDFVYNNGSINKDEFENLAI